MLVKSTKMDAENTRKRSSFKHTYGCDTKTPPVGFEIATDVHFEKPYISNLKDADIWLWTTEDDGAEAGNWVRACRKTMRQKESAEKSAAARLRTPFVCRPCEDSLRH